jgi:hypothetical protein
MALRSVWRAEVISKIATHDSDLRRIFKLHGSDDDKLSGSCPKLPARSQPRQNPGHESWTRKSVIPISRIQNCNMYSINHCVYWP